jgi:hypothetical protein
VSVSFVKTFSLVLMTRGGYGVGENLARRHASFHIFFLLKFLKLLNSGKLPEAYMPIRMLHLLYVSTSYVLQVDLRTPKSKYGRFLPMIFWVCNCQYVNL